MILEQPSGPRCKETQLQQLIEQECQELVGVLEQVDKAVINCKYLDKVKVLLKVAPVCLMLSMEQATVELWEV